MKIKDLKIGELYCLPKNRYFPEVKPLLLLKIADNSEVCVLLNVNDNNYHYTVPQRLIPYNFNNTKNKKQ